jgi:ferredoxin-NADP reductase
MNARFINLEWENDARTIGTIYLQPDKPYYFTPGQYAGITVPHDNPDSRGLTRTMTFSSSSLDRLLACTIRFGNSQSTYKHALLALKPGSKVGITDAMGDMVLPLDESIPLVFVAGGLGIASYVSMVRWLTTQKDKRDITLLYAVRDIGDIIFRKHFDAYSSIGTFKNILFTTDHKVDSLLWNGEINKSRLTSADIHKYISDPTQVYLSGAEQMVEQFRRELLDTYKLPQYRLVFDFFDGYTEL